MPRILVAFCAAASIATSIHAAITNVAWYRLGENDPNAASGLAVTNTTTDFVGVNHLKQFGSPLYTNAVSTGAVGSFLSLQFNGVSQNLTGAVVSTAVSDFGIEAWVKPATVVGFQVITYNGDVFGDGWGLVQDYDLNYKAWVNGTGIGLFPATVDTWSHLALVNQGGLVTFYVNGAPHGSGIPTPIPPSSGFAIGAHAAPFVGDYFNGAVDEVRVFTFGPGQFSASDLLFNLQLVATLPATGITPTNAMLNGSANPAGLPASAWFEWGTTTNYGIVTPPQAFGSGTGATNFSRVVTGLLGGVTYHFRAVASNSLIGNVVFSTNQSFTTPVFYLTATNLTGLYSGSAVWGDYDNDGRLDILLAGSPVAGSRSCQVWRNTGSGFTNIDAGLPGVAGGSAAWGDFDNDGRLDILLTGTTGGFSQVWRNTGSGFTNINAGLPEVAVGSAVWGDYDNDGRLDILLTGSTNFPSGIAQVWRNTGGGFMNIDAGLPGVTFSSAVWGDYDNDGRLDILLTGGTNNPFGIAQVWRNTGGGFMNINAGLPGIAGSSAAWGDYDNDGRLDILLTGNTGGLSFVSQVWRNTGSGFTNINADLPGVNDGSTAWGDYDNDGRLDILLTGATSVGGYIAQVWRNTGSGFTNINESLPGVFDSSTAWGDYDNDGRLDILLTGVTGIFPYISQVWRNNMPLTNTPPAAPNGLAVSTTSTTVTLAWDAAGDAQSPPASLTYNVRAGTAPGGFDLMGPMADSNGFRRVVEMGNRQLVRAFLFDLPIDQPIYWSVQAVDSAFAGSAFSTQSSFRLNSAFLSPASGPVSGDTNGDGIVSGPEFETVLLHLNGIVSDSDLQLVLENYWPYSPFLEITNVAGLGSSNVLFALPDPTLGAFGVEASSNMVDWLFRGPASPRYFFTDTNSPASTQRFYRLRWP